MHNPALFTPLCVIFDSIESVSGHVCVSVTGGVFWSAAVELSPQRAW